jgi:hypothetical protein
MSGGNEQVAVGILCVLCQLAAPGLKWNFSPGAAPPEDEQVMLKTCRGP